MPTPSSLPNSAKIIRASRRIIETDITTANGYWSDGVLVDLGRDPTLVARDLVDEYRRKPRVVSLLPGTGRFMPDARVGGYERWQVFYVGMCHCELTETQRDAGYTTTDIQEMLAEDLRKALRPDSKIKAAVAALGLGECTCFTHGVIEVRSADKPAWPYVDFDVVIAYRMDRSTA
jgi:hypothetical protein